MNTEFQSGPCEDPEKAVENSIPEIKAAPLFPVVGIGASAGGLAALTRLLANLSSTTGMAFVVIQHLDPTHESQLAHLLAREAPMPVQDAAHELEIRPNHIYVIPSNCLLGIHQGRLVLSPRESVRGSQLAIDYFFRSLAIEYESQAVGVLLTGTGSDGTMGLAEIKAATGITFAQDPANAEYSEMPRSAIAYGCVDFVLSEVEIANELNSISRHPFLKHSGSTEGDDPFAVEEGTYDRILTLLQMSGGIDFSQYRSSTIKRRILRRMAMRSCLTLPEYIKILTEKPAEGQQLLKDVLINVTNFFRDESVFQALRVRVFPELNVKRSSDSAIRIWVAGCSTGQETYSLAIELVEYLDADPERPMIQIFATDISEHSLIKARNGVYPDNVRAEITPERLRRHFTKVTEGYRVNKSIRDMCVFARHDLISDTPFSKIDLISCRNVLIYLSPTSQMRIMPTFHYALNVPGFLVLGTSETTGRSSDLFNCIDQNARIYSKNKHAARTHPHVPSMHQERAREKIEQHAVAGNSNVSDLQRAADRLALARYAPPGVLIDSEFSIIQFRGSSGDIIDHSSGEASLNLLKMAPYGLALALKELAEEARRLNSEVHRTCVRYRDRSGLREIDLRLSPIRPFGAKSDCLLVSFETCAKKEVQDVLVSEIAVPASGRDLDIGMQLRQELSIVKGELTTAHEYMESLVDENNRVTDELKFANDEAHSGNEELRCANEELQTAKEEVESANEELATLNEELRSRNMDLTILSNDLNNLLEGIDLPIVMLSSDLRLRRLTVAAERVFHMVSTDIGRSVSFMSPMFNGPDLAKLSTEVIASGQASEIEVMDQEGHWYNLQIKPYRTEGGRITGAVIAMIDIHGVKGTQDGLRKSADFSQAVVEMVREPLLVLNRDLHVHTVNHAFCRNFNIPASEVIGQDIFALGHGLWKETGLRSLIENTLQTRSSFEAFEATCDIPGIGVRHFLLSARCLDGLQWPSLMVIMGITDVTEQKRLTDDLRSSGVELMRSNSELEHFASIASHDLQEPVRMIRNFGEIILRKCDGKLDSPCREYLDFMIGGAKRMQEMIQSILEYSRAGHQVLSIAAVDLNLVIQSVLLNLDVAIQAARATIECGAMPTIVVDGIQITQLFQNLIANGLKFRSNERPCLITICVLESGLDWSFSISDTGIGIKHEDFDRIFKLVHCLHPLGDYLGTGIGLATCKKIIERHRGRLWPESRADGTTFHFSIPKQTLS